jgi:hypothetical protein
VQNVEKVTAYIRPARRASISFSLNPRPSGMGEGKESKDNDGNARDEETGHASGPNTDRNIRPPNRATLMDVARGRTSLIGFLDHKTTNRRMGFHERSAQNNIAKMQKVNLLLPYCYFFLFV